MKNLNDAKRQDLIDSILAITEKLNNIRDLDMLLDRILLEARKFTKADAGSIFLSEGDQLTFSYVQNDTLFKAGRNNKAIYSSHTIPVDQTSIAGYVAATGKHLVIDDVYRIGDDVPYSFNTSFDKVSRYRTTSVLTVPLTTGRDHTVGVLEIINATGDNGEPVPFTEEDQVFATYFANNAAVAVERAMMTREIILRMLRMSELRDPKETGAHVNRVGAFAAEIYHRWALEHGVSTDEIKHNRDLLRLAAMMHDVGKVAISDAILKKPGKLDENEYAIMKHHTVHGALLFANPRSDLDVISREVALRHHERWDGKGYPGDYSGTDIDSITMGQGMAADGAPLFGRIVALADVYDALSSIRCYKDAWPQEKVLEEIRKCSGTQFDPEVVEAFLDIYDVIEAIREKYTE